MKISILTVIFLTFLTNLFFDVGVLADDDRHCHGDDCGHSATRVRAKVIKGTPSSPSPRRFQPDEELPPRPPIPTGHPRGPIRPLSPAVNLTRSGTTNNDNTTLVTRNQCKGKGLAFGKSTIFGTQGINPSEPSGAKAGRVVFTTANEFASISTDGGVTFHVIDPTVYSGPANPSTDGGFCCDQVVHYLPSIDRFVWLIQYWSNSKSVNKLRLITFHPRDVDNSGIKSWLFLDIVSTDLKLKGPLDYGDLAVGNIQLYVSATNTGIGLVVIRVPIAALNVVGPLTLWYTDPAIFSHLSQNPGDTVFWAGHSMLGTNMLVFKWPESGTTYFGKDIRIQDWPADPTNFVSPCPGAASTNWVFSLQFHDIIGVTRRSKDEVWFAWPAHKGGGFPNLHQIAQINVSKWPNLSLIKQWQIWNPSFAFGYPSLYTNDCGDVGLAVAFGGGPFNPSSAVGIADSNGVLTHTVYYPELSDVCQGRFGDYLTVRKGTGLGFDGFIFAGRNVNSNLQWRPRFFEFNWA